MKKIPFEDLLEMWECDKNGEYIQVYGDKAYFMSCGSRQEEILPHKNDIYKGISLWMDAQKFWPNIWEANDHGNVNLMTKTGKNLGGIV